MEKTFNVIVERDSEGYLITSVPELRGCHTQAKSFDVLEKRIVEVIQPVWKSGEVLKKWGRNTTAIFRSLYQHDLFTASGGH